MKGLDAFQIEQLEQIADYLHDQRQRQSVSLDKVAQETFIPLRLLQALENKEIDRLPEPVYIKGFIRRYGDAIGLDGSEIADAFPIEPAPIVQEFSEAQVEPPIQVPEPSRTRFKSSSETSLNWKPYLPYGLAGLGIAAFIGAIAWAGSTVFKPSTSSVATDPGKSSTATTQPTAPSTTSSSDKDINSASLPPASSTDASKEDAATAEASSTPVQLDISLTDRSWVEVVADGKVQYEGILPKGEQRTWKAQKNITIRAGNAGAVVASYNQGEAKPLGKAGQVVDAEFPGNNQAQSGL